jgi:hypothetical protein
MRTTRRDGDDNGMGKLDDIGIFDAPTADSMPKRSARMRDAFDALRTEIRGLFDAHAPGVGEHHEQRALSALRRTSPSAMRH